MAKTASSERKDFREAHCFLVKAAKVLQNQANPARGGLNKFGARFLEEIQAWNPEYFSTEAIQARRLLRKGGTFPVTTPGYRRPTLSAMDRVIAGTPQPATAGH